MNVWIKELGGVVWCFVKLINSIDFNYVCLLACMYFSWPLAYI